LAGLDDLPLARASVRQEFLRRSRHWRDQVQQVGERFETRLEGWLEEPPWDAPPPRTADWQPDELEDEEPLPTPEAWSGPEPWDEDSWAEPEPRADRQRDRQDDPWV
jgi:hypothetical protein